MGLEILERILNRNWAEERKTTLWFDLVDND
jgi:hypothetical protein